MDLDNFSVVAHADVRDLLATNQLITDPPAVSGVVSIVRPDNHIFIRAAMEVHSMLLSCIAEHQHTHTGSLLRARRCK